MAEQTTVPVDPQALKHPRLTRLDNWGLRAITGSALIFAVIALVVFVMRAVQLLTAQTLEVGPLRLINATTPAFASESAAIVSARYDSATLVVDGLPSGVRWLFLSHVAADALLTIGLCVIVFWLGMKLIAQRPFARSAGIAIFIAAMLIMIVGLFSPFLEGVANSEAVQFLGASVLGAGEGGGESPVNFGFNLDFAPIGWGLSLALVSSAFFIGERMQRDSDGLV